MLSVTKVLEWIREHKDETFEWGSNDCCMFVCNYLLEMTGKDPAEPYRGRYKTQRGALKALKKYGSISEAIDKHFERVDPMYLSRGDVVLFHVEGMGDTLGIKWSNGVYCVGHDGCHVVDISFDQIIASWRIEE